MDNTQQTTDVEGGGDGQSTELQAGTNDGFDEIDDGAILAVLEANKENEENDEGTNNTQNNNNKVCCPSCGLDLCSFLGELRDRDDRGNRDDRDDRDGEDGEMGKISNHRKSQREKKRKRNYQEYATINLKQRNMRGEKTHTFPDDCVICNARAKKRRESTDAMKETKGKPSKTINPQQSCQSWITKGEQQSCTQQSVIISVLTKIKSKQQPTTRQQQQQQTPCRVATRRSSK